MIYGIPRCGASSPASSGVGLRKQQESIRTATEAGVISAANRLNRSN
jgi:hypothetical protein